MTEDEVIALGQYCEDLLQQENFTTLVKQFETQTIEHLLTTRPEEKERREDIYQSMRGVRDFLGLMKFFVANKNAFLEAQGKELSDDDALPLEF